MKITLFKKRWESPVAWATEDTEKLIGEIEYRMIFDFKNGLRFSVTSGNINSCTRGPLKCLFHVLEHEAVGMGKYCRLKDRVRIIGVWNRL